MRAVILAAGAGTRLATMGWNKPKCLLPIGGYTLLDRLLAALQASSIGEAVVVVGYQRELIERVVARGPVRCDVVINSGFAETNTLHSLWLARDYLTDGFLYFNADILFDRRIVKLLLSIRTSAIAVQTRACGAEEVKVMVDGGQRVIHIGKTLTPKHCLGESVGIVQFAPAACPAMIASLERFQADAGNRGLFFESALDDILGQHRFTAVGLGNRRAIEIDTPEDYAAAQSLWDSGDMQAVTETNDDCP